MNESMKGVGRMANETAVPVQRFGMSSNV